MHINYGWIIIHKPSAQLYVFAETCIVAPRGEREATLPGDHDCHLPTHMLVNSTSSPCRCVVQTSNVRAICSNTHHPVVIACRWTNSHCEGLHACRCSLWPTVLLDGDHAMQQSIHACIGCFISLHLDECSRMHNWFILVIALRVVDFG